MAAGLGFEETELRLGLPGGGNDAGDAAARKRGFEETIDLKLKLEQPAAAARDREEEQESAAAEVVPAAASPAAASAGTTMKRSTSQSSVVTAAERAQPDPDDDKPRAHKAQAVGWPPVRSFRKNVLSSQLKGGSKDGDGTSNPAAAAFVKVSMDGAPYLRKVDLRTHGGYQELSKALEKMFFCSFSTIAAAGSYCGSQQGKKMTTTTLEGMNEETKLADLQLSGSEYVPTYEDKDGDWMLVGDVPWEMFVESCKRLRIMKASEAVGLAPRAMEKCKNIIDC